MLYMLQELEGFLNNDKKVEATLVDNISKQKSSLQKLQMRESDQKISWKI